MSEKVVGSDESLRLTRSSTVFHALVRLFGSEKLPSHLVLHVVGADHREGTTPEETRSVFADLFQRVGQEKQVRELDMLFCGPNIAPRLHDTRHSFTTHHHVSAEKGRNFSTTTTTTTTTIHGDVCDGPLGGEGQQGPRITPGVGAASNCRGTSASSSSSAAAAGILAVTLRYNSGLYHDVSGLFHTPDALFLFNAGLWGYDDWEPTLEHVLGCSCCSSSAYDAGHNSTDNDYDGNNRSASSAPAVVVTSYCPEEASDDMETIQRVLLGDDGRCKCSLGLSVDDDAASIIPENVGVGGLEWLWKPEVNPHRSLVPRRTECGVEGRVLFENQSWQALRRSRGRGASPQIV